MYQHIILCTHTMNKHAVHALAWMQLLLYERFTETVPSSHAHQDGRKGVGTSHAREGDEARASGIQVYT